MHIRKRKVTIYTDGSYSQDSKGGWAAVLIYDNFLREIWGFEPKEATSFRMELLAVIRALDRHKRHHDITIYTDNEVIVDANTTGRLNHWIAGNWERSNGEVKDKDLWSILFWHTQKHKITWKKVKAHSGDKYNSRADELAQIATRTKSEGVNEYYIEDDGSLKPLTPKRGKKNARSFCEN